MQYVVHIEFENGDLEIGGVTFTGQMPKGTTNRELTLAITKFIEKDTDQPVKSLKIIAQNMSPEEFILTTPGVHKYFEKGSS